MMEKLKKISLGNWILIGMISGLIVGLFFNFWVDDHFIKNIIFMENIFYLGGNIFIRLLKMLIVPLVFFSIVVGVVSISNSRKLAEICGSTVCLYLFTTLIGIIIAAGISLLIGPGQGVNISNVAQTSNTTINQTIPEVILSIIPENPLSAFTENNMLEIVILSILVGYILTKLGDKIQILNTVLEESNKVVIEMTGIIMKFAPIGVFCLMASTFGTMEFESLIPLSKFIGCVLIGLAIHAFVIYPMLLVIFTGLSPLKFFRKYESVMFFAFSTLSTSAAIPATMNKLKDMGVSKEISSVTAPLGSSINKDGTAIMQCVAVFFVAQAYGIDLGTSTILMVIIAVLTSSLNVLSAPFSGFITLPFVLYVVGLPVEGIGILLCTDYLLDMFRTSVNITGDGICTIIVASWQNYMDKNKFNSKIERKN